MALSLTTYHRYVGYDPDGVPRVFAECPNPDVAETRCIEEVFKWRKERHDRRPYSDWIVNKEY